MNVNNQAGVYEGDLPLSSDQHRPVTIPESSFFGILKSKKAYASIMYLLLLFPISLGLFVYTITMTSLSAGLIITIFGIPLAYFFLLTLPRVNLIQAALANVILDIPMPQLKMPDPQGKSFLDRFWEVVSDDQVLKSLVSSILVFPFAIIGFVFVITFLSVSISLMAVIAYPLVRLILMNTGINIDDPVTTAIFDVIPEPIVLGTLFIVGFLLFVISLHLSKYMAYAHAKIIRYLYTS